MMEAAVAMTMAKATLAMVAVLEVVAGMMTTVTTTAAIVVAATAKAMPAMTTAM